MDKTQRIRDLEDKLTEAQDAYYAGEPVMSDAKYDALFDELRDLDPANPVLKRVGTKIKDARLRKVKHEIPMGSQSKVNTKDDFLAWVKKTGADRFTVQEKLDGLSVELVYEKGELKTAITRGDGEEGEDVTHTVSEMSNVFGTLPDKFTGSLRGEIMFTKKAFDQLVGKSGEYTNPRNAAAGLTRRKDVHKAVPHMSVTYYDCLTDKLDFEKEHHKIRFMENALKLGCVFTKVCSLDNAIAWYESYQEELRAELDHEIDGLVIKVADLEAQEALGETDGRPKGQVAWKFANEMRSTILEDVEWDVGLGGRVTPVAILKPVGIGGVTVTRATLHNVSNMTKLGVWKGAEVLVCRAGDVIPRLEQVVKPAKGNKFGYPTECPRCKAPTKFEGEFLTCPNSQCPAKIRGDILKWINTLGIDQAGESFVNAAVDAGLIKDPADLYTLQEDKLSKLPGFGKSSAKTIVDNVNKAKEIPLAKFLGALNIQNASESTFSALVNAGFETLDDLRTAAIKKMSLARGIGDTTAQVIFNGLAVKATLIDKLLKNGVSIKKKVVGKLTGRSFCFTGEISIKRPDAVKLVESMGGEVKSSVSKGLSYLVQASATSNSTKSQKAKSYGTEVIGESEFFKLVEFSIQKLRSLT